MMMTIKQLTIPTHQRMRKLGALVAQVTKPRDIIFLTGEMGTGKSVFAQGFIQHLCMDEHLRVPSPTFLLDNTYESRLGDTKGSIIHHMDLYRLGSINASSLARLSLPDIWNQQQQQQSSTISIIEWADKLQEFNNENKWLRFENYPILYIDMHYNLEKYSMLLKNEEDEEVLNESGDERFVTIKTEHEDWKARLEQLHVN